MGHHPQVIYVQLRRYITGRKVGGRIGKERLGERWKRKVGGRTEKERLGER